MECLEFLGRQGIPFQGNENNDNFTQLLLFHCNEEEKKRLSSHRNNHEKKMSQEGGADDAAGESQSKQVLCQWPMKALMFLIMETSLYV